MNNMYTINKEVSKIKKMREEITSHNDRIDDMDKKINNLVSKNFLNFDNINDTLNEIANIKGTLVKINEDILKINEEVKPKVSEFEYPIDYKDEVYVFLEKITYEQYYHIFKTLGCECLEDILLLNEKDFFSNEIPLLHVRKILKKVKYYLEIHTNDSVDL